MAIDPVDPPPNTPRVVEEHPASPYLATVKSPKSVALPVVAMVMYSITLELAPSVPPPNTPRVVEEQAPSILLSPVKSPKSVALPVVAMVM